jgi:very-short-patch-repair endonuclease
MEIDRFPIEPFTMSTAKACGISPAKVRRGVRQRQLVMALRGVYLRSDVELTTPVKLAAAVLVISPNAVACDRTAAWLWGVEVFDYAELDSTPPLETYVLRGYQPTDRPEVRGGVRDLMHEDWVEIGGVKVTTPLRTALDLGCKLNRRPALAAMDSLMRKHAFTHAEMRRLAVRFFRRRGVVQLRELIPLVDPRAESQPESWTRLELIDHGLPSPKPQHWILIGGVPTYRLDLAYPHARVAIEYEGEEFHTSDEDREADERRREWLERHGWIVIVVTKESFSDVALAEWIGQVREALARAQRPRRRIYS